MRRLARLLRNYLFDKWGIRIDIHPPRPAWSEDRTRVNYQDRIVNLNIRAGERVLDVGSGGDPFPFATVLVDRFLEENYSRHESLATNGKPFVLADVRDLPFSDASFDVVRCSSRLAGRR